MTSIETAGRDGSPPLRLADPDRFSWRHWDGELLFFDDLSGETRLLGGCAGMVLELIAEGQPVTLGALQAALAAAVDLPLDQALRDRVRDAADALRRYGLIGDAAP